MSSFEKTHQIIESFIERALSGLKMRSESMPFDSANEEIYIVATALLARQVTLATQFASAPQIWTGHSAPLFFRPMTDVQITLEWITAEPLSRSKSYIEYGLGQAKLQVEHWKKALENEPQNENLQQGVKNIAEWIDSQHLSALVNVNVGSWSGESTRKIAEEVGILDFYNYAYSPFSNCVHSTWFHIGRYNLRRSESPLHCYRFLPDITECDPNIEELILCSKYLDKTFNFFDSKILKSEACSNIQQWMISEILKTFGEEPSKKES